MARQRRGFRTPELRGTLGTLLRTTREVLERGAREGRNRLDEALASRRRDGALAELGEIVLELIRRGEIDVAELPEARDVVAHLDDLDAGHAEDHDQRTAKAPVRKRFDARAARGDGTVSSATWSRGGNARPRPADEPTRDLGAPRRGGISFEDEDLDEYMHPDDVAPKRSPEGDS